MVKILLLIDYSSEFDRKLLRGLINYAKEKGDWIFYRLPSYYVMQYGSKGVMEWAKKWGASAIVGKCIDQTVDLQNELNIPVVLQNYHRKSVSCSNLTGEYHGTGKMAATYFNQKMFHNYAYFGVKGVIWSDERFKGYSQEVERLGGSLFSYDSRSLDDDSRHETARWLQQLPKPVALFCCDDEHALFISDTCKIVGIRIPDEISLLGVDNDELMCTISDPPISSIELEIEHGGYMMGKLLDHQIRNGINNNFNIVIKPVSIERRQSTEKYDIDDANVLKAVQFIDNHYAEDISVESILNYVPLSRRSLETKFKHTMHASMYQYLLSRRCERMAQLILTTSRPLRELSSQVGFNDFSSASRAFTQYFKCTPQEYRDRSGSS